MAKEIMPAGTDAHKAQEFGEMLRLFGCTVKTLLDLKGDIKIRETGAISEENALIRAKAIRKRLRTEVTTNDNGLVVNMLDGVPGIYSARLMGRGTSCDVKNQYLIDQRRRAGDKGCQLICTIVYVQADSSEHVFTGIVEGTVVDHMEGAKSSDYDPASYCPPYGTTLASVSEEQKNRVSHHGRALAKLVAFMEKEN